MNYLGHAWLSFGVGDVLAGNMVGDHVKGRLPLQAMAPGMASGVLLHRKIDAFCDNHPATRRGKLFFREVFGLYSGAVMDVVFDHFLANDPALFATDAELLAFTEQVYQQLDERLATLPPAFLQYYPYMKEENWLYKYRTLKGIERSLQGLARRAKHMPPAEKAYGLFVGHFYQLNQCYFELIEDLVQYVKIETPTNLLQE
ncbi:MAG: DUF479 domain-containing protein [Chitinophagia bacterium]|nr:DUF479 domain-containing protein [Chitinophagia bacterium]